MRADRTWAQGSGGDPVARKPDGANSRDDGGLRSAAAPVGIPVTAVRAAAQAQTAILESAGLGRGGVGSTPADYPADPAGCPGPASTDTACPDSRTGSPAGTLDPVPDPDLDPGGP